MATLETMVQEWQQVPPQYLESVYQLVHVLTVRQPAPGLLIHADRGSQYTSAACRARIE